MGSFLYEIVLTAALLILAFQLRHIPNEFSIMTELFLIVWVRCITIGVRYFIIFWYVDSPFVQLGYIVYLTTLLDIAQMFITGVYTLRQTYKINQIIPFPINEDCICNFMVAIIMPTSMTHFYQYLQNLPEFDEALIIFGLHADIRFYMRMYEERDEFSRDMIHAKAVQIFEDYITEDCKWMIRPSNS